MSSRRVSGGRNLYTAPLRTRSLRVVGIMTGNSLDAADACLTRVAPDGSMRDLAFYSVPFSDGLRAGLLTLRDCFKRAAGEHSAACALFRERTGHDARHVVRAYTLRAAAAAAGVRKAAPRHPAALIGFHGQTLAHCPPSAALAGESPYTVQIGDAALLARLLGLPVMADFRSDDLFAGGEGAPFAPSHHAALAPALRAAGCPLPVVLLNCGNTSNLTKLAWDEAGCARVSGFDAGPCNHFPDLLARTEARQACDMDGRLALKGSVCPHVVEAILKRGALTADGRDFLELTPPKSSDPLFYRTVPELTDSAISLPDRMRSAVYAAAYTAVRSLRHLPDEARDVRTVLAFGGGYRHPAFRAYLRSLLCGGGAGEPILPEDVAFFARLRAEPVQVEDSGAYGADGRAMEARIFADAAVRRWRRVPFTEKAVTGASALCGIAYLPPSMTALGLPSARHDPRARAPWISRAAPGELASGR